MWRFVSVLLVFGLAAKADELTVNKFTLNCEVTGKVPSPIWEDLTAKVKIGDPVSFDIEFGLYEELDPLNSYNANTELTLKRVFFRSRIRSNLWTYSEYFSQFGVDDLAVDILAGGKFTQSRKDKSLEFKSNQFSLGKYTKLEPGHFILMELSPVITRSFKYRNIFHESKIMKKYDHTWEYGDTKGNFMYGTCAPIDLRFDMFDAVYTTVNDLTKEGIISSP